MSDQMRARRRHARRRRRWKRRHGLGDAGLALLALLRGTGTRAHDDIEIARAFDEGRLPR